MTIPLSHGAANSLEQPVRSLTWQQMEAMRSVPQDGEADRLGWPAATLAIAALSLSFWGAVGVLGSWMFR